MKNFNPNIRKGRSKRPDPEHLIAGMLDGNVMSLSQAITLTESERPEDQQAARQLVDWSIKQGGSSLRMGITGVPGAGKSTLIDALGSRLIEEGHRVAVLAVDPSSARSKGSILGDKTRMDRLSVHPKAFVRPSPSASSLGGVAKKTREVMLLCEAFGYDRVLLETVGVGQSEIAVRDLVDFFLLVLIPGAGDELQGIKRGVVEMADAIVINKSEEQNDQLSSQAVIHYQRALRLFHSNNEHWKPSVGKCSALKETGLDWILDQLQAFYDASVKSGFFLENRSQQAVKWLHQTIEERLKQRFRTDNGVRKQLPSIEEEVRKGQTDPFAAAGILLDLYLGESKK